MAIIGINTDATSKYVCKEDRESEKPTTWDLGTLSSRILGVISDKGASFVPSADEDGEAHAEFRGNEVSFLTCKFGLRGWTGFITPDGAEIPFESKPEYVPNTTVKMSAVSDVLLSLIPLDNIKELAENITKANQVDAALGKP